MLPTSVTVARCWGEAPPDSGIGLDTAEEMEIQMNRISAAIVPMLILVVGCGGGGSQSTDPFVIGLSADFTGPINFVGVPVRDGAMAYFNYTNSHGGVDGHQLKPILLDDKSDANTAIANVKQLAEQDHVVGSVGFVFTGVVAPVEPSLDQYQMPIMTIGASAAEMSIPNKWIYQVDFLGFQSPSIQAKYIAQLTHSDNAKVATLAYSNSSGADWTAKLQQQLKTLGNSVVAQPLTTDAATDVTPQVRAIVAAHPDIVLTALTDKVAVLFMHTLRTLNPTVPVLNWTGGSSLLTLSSLNDPNFYVTRSVAYSTVDNAGVSQLKTILAAAKVDPSAAYVEKGYLEGVVMVAGLKKCGFPCSGPKLQAALDSIGSIDTKGLTAVPLQFSPTNHAGMPVAAVYNFVGGKPTLVPAA